jgi:elongator complex protein 3 (tRNA carboxymethyluridine synthase)
VRPRRAQRAEPRDGAAERRAGQAAGAARRARAGCAFDPRAHEAELRGIIEAVSRAPELDARALDRILKQHPKHGVGLFSRSEVIAGYRALADGDARSEAAFVARLRLRPVRTLSGVTPVTVLTKPYPCPGQCVFCPSDVRMPKSYLADEPGAQRAEDNRFDPYLQTWNRLAAYRRIGHPVEKVELIVLGGTWSAYPVPYQVWFTKRCFDALSDFGAGLDGRRAAGAAPSRYRELAARTPTNHTRYNEAVGALLAAQLGGGRLHASEGARWEALEAAQRRNETAGCRCVGLVFETRPDRVTPAEVLRLRRLGATKVQLGIQSLDEDVLVANLRGHGVAATRRALKLLRGAGFKLHAHWMPNLLGATPASDVADYARLFDEADFRPDELKIYPCMLIPSAALAAHHARGAWQAYSDAALLEVLAACIEQTPRYCRLTRVIRDFSAHDIAAGTHTANLREVAERRLAARGVVPSEIRSREIRGAAFARAALRLTTLRYATSCGEEVFLEFVTPDDRLVAFLRLSLPSEPSCVAELGRSAVIRELHVYGASLPLGARAREIAQHGGLGRALVEAAAACAADAGYVALSVISAVGTRAYYRGLGFRDGALYQHRALAAAGGA